MRRCNTVGPLLVTKYVLFTGNVLKKGSQICNITSKARGSLAPMHHAEWCANTALDAAAWSPAAVLCQAHCICPAPFD